MQLLRLTRVSIIFQSRIKRLNINQLSRLVTSKSMEQQSDDRVNMGEEYNVLW